MANPILEREDNRVVVELVSPGEKPDPRDPVEEDRARKPEPCRVVVEPGDLGAVVDVYANTKALR